PRLGGVLLSGERGTGKSTVVRGFSRMIQGSLPVTLPINATEDRVVGGWNVAEALKGNKEWQHGLLHEAGRDNQILYVDEVNLLDDHIVNILLDVTSTGILEVQREGIARRDVLELTLVGTMNPEEGGLRPQLLDRFALMVQVKTEEQYRRAVLETVLAFDDALARRERGEASDFLEEMTALDGERKERLQKAREASPEIS
ncbi:MAG: AAA domain-containing protein, partial [bacterium]|nr:AAA domain-containing protein [bacterium]